MSASGKLAVPRAYASGYVKGLPIVYVRGAVLVSQSISYY
jgi:hypothetical protein